MTPPSSSQVYASLTTQVLLSSAQEVVKATMDVLFSGGQAPKVTAVAMSLTTTPIPVPR